MESVVKSISPRETTIIARIVDAIRKIADDEGVAIGSVDITFPLDDRYYTCAHDLITIEQGAIDAEIEYVHGSFYDDPVPTRKIVINRRIGGFGLSDGAIDWLIEHKGWSVRGIPATGDDPNRMVTQVWYDPADECTFGERYFCPESHTIAFRTHPDVIEVVETLKEASYGSGAILKIIEIPENVDIQLCESEEGYEWIVETHRTWS